MKKNLTEMVFILDKSGSMSGLEKDTIGGFNSMIERQRKEPGEAFVSTVLFANESTVIHDRTDIRKVEPLTEQQYLLSALKYTVSLGVDILIPPGNFEHFKFAAEHADETWDEPLTEKERSLLKNHLHEVADHPFYEEECYK